MFDPEAVTISYNGTVACRQGIDAGSGPPRWRRSWPSATSMSCVTSRPVTRTATMLFTDLSHAYIDENRGTSDG